MVVYCFDASYNMSTSKVIEYMWWNLSTISAPKCIGMDV